MSDERLDKQWQQKGLSGYTTAAILGTLEHYGVSVDPSSFRAQAQLFYPLTIASSWMRLWKGTGKFAKLPGAAVEELWRRLAPQLLQPLDLVDALTQLLRALLRLRQRDDTAPVEAKFAELDGVIKRLPEAAERREHFLAEVVMVMSDSLETLDLMAEGLAKDGHLKEAERFVAAEEALFPARRGVGGALVLAARDERPAALAQLQAIAADPGREGYARIAAIDALLHLKAREQALPGLTTLGEGADAANDGELLGALDRRWHALVEAITGPAQSEVIAGLRKSHQRMERFGGHHHWAAAREAKM